MTLRPADNPNKAAKGMEEVFLDHENFAKGSDEAPEFFSPISGSAHGDNIPRASRCPSPVMDTDNHHDLRVAKAEENEKSQEKKGGADSVDPEKVPREDKNMSDAASQYESEADSQCNEDTHPHLSRQPIENFSGKGYNAIRLALKNNRITKSGTRQTPTPARSYTRGQNEAATKAAVREVAEEVKDIKNILTGLFAAMGNKEEMEEKRWQGFHDTWVRTNEK